MRHYGLYIDEALTLDRDLNANGVATDTGERLFYHNNSLYSVFGVSDSNRVFAERYLYDAYGRPIIWLPGPDAVYGTADDVRSVNGSSTVQNVRLFTGREWDGESLLYYFRARYQSPRFARFISRDPAFGASLTNLYEYVRGRSTTQVDPSGLMSVGDAANCFSGFFNDPNKYALLMGWQDFLTNTGCSFPAITYGQFNADGVTILDRNLDWNTCDLTIAFNPWRLTDCNHMWSVLLHEMSQAANLCMGCIGSTLSIDNVFPSDSCRRCVCFEIQAFSFDEACKPGGRLNQSTDTGFRFPSEKDCIKNFVQLACRTSGHCGLQHNIPSEVDNVWELCRRIGWYGFCRTSRPDSRVGRR